MSLPTATKLAASTKYFVAGTRKYWIVPSIASKGAPTLAELNANTDVSDSVVAGSVTGFNFSTENHAVPDAGGRFTGTIPGRTTADDSSLLFYADITAADIRSLLTQDLNTFVVIFPEGVVTGGKLHVFPVRVSSQSDEQDTEDSGRIMVSFSITSAPVRNIAIPTS